MNRFPPNLNSSGVWMESNNRCGSNSFGGGNNDQMCDNMWERNSGNGMRSQFDFNRTNNFAGNSGAGNNGSSNSSFLSFLDQRSTQSQPLIHDAPMMQNIRQNDGNSFGNQSRNWNRDDFNSGNMNMLNMRSGNGGGMRGPLLNEPFNQDVMRQTGLLEFPRNDGNNLMNMGNQNSGGMMGNPNSGGMMGNQNVGGMMGNPNAGGMMGNSNVGGMMSNQMSFCNSNDDSESDPVVITVPRADIGSKIIGKKGVLVRDLENKTRARIEVIDKPGTNSAIVEVYGTNDSRRYAVQIIKAKCGPSIDIEMPRDKPRSLFDMPMGNSSGNNFRQRNQSNNRGGNYRENPFTAGFNSSGGNQGYGGQGLLKSPMKPSPNMPYWKNAPKPLMSQKIGPNVANKSSLRDSNSSKKFYNTAIKKQNFNSSRSNSMNSSTNKNFAGKKRPWIKPGVTDSSENSTTSTGAAVSNKKAKKRDLYEDSDFVPEQSTTTDGDSAQQGQPVGWMDGLTDLAKSLTKVRDNFVPPTAGPNPLENWTKNSKLPYDHFAAGSFETGFELLKKLYGIVNIEPFKQLALSAYTCSKVEVAIGTEMPPLVELLSRKPKVGGTDVELPIPTFQLSELLKRLQIGYSLTTSGKFSEAVDTFRGILFTIPMLVTNDKSELAKVKKLTIICREYITGLSLEMARLKLPKNTLEEQKRNCELAAYFTRCNLQASHRMLTLSTALNLFFKLKNFKTAVSFAQKLLELEPSPDMVPQLNKIVEVCNSNLADEHELNYEDAKTFAFCSQTLMRIKQGEPDIRCPFCHVRCIKERKGFICKVCTVAEIGKDVIPQGRMEESK